MARDRRKDSDETIWEETHATADLLLFCLLQSNRMGGGRCTNEPDGFLAGFVARAAEIRKECDMSLNNCLSLLLVQRNEHVATLSVTNGSFDPTGDMETGQMHCSGKTL